MQKRKVFLSLAGALVLGLSACTAGAPESTVSTLAQPPVLVSSFPEASPSAQKLDQDLVQVPAYWIGRTGDNAYLFRENQRVDRKANSVQAAIEAMMSLKPQDKDYFTAWQAPKRVGVSVARNNTITVDISRNAFSGNLDPSMAQRAVQQLVYTTVAAANEAGVTDGRSEPTVVILVDGQSGYQAFGKVTLGEPMQRDLSLLSPIWVNSPSEDEVRAPGPLLITGVVLGQQNAAQWSLERVDENGNAQALTSGRAPLERESEDVGRFAITVELKPGTYTVTVMPAKGAVQTVRPQDTKTFTIS